MRRWLSPLVVFDALLAWLWWSGYVLIDKCLDAGGSWNAEARICALDVTPARP